MLIFDMFSKIYRYSVKCIEIKYISKPNTKLNKGAERLIAISEAQLTFDFKSLKILAPKRDNDTFFGATENKCINTK